MAISKWSPEGKLLWSTLVGSPGHDRPYSVKVDSQGCVYAAGIGGVGMPVSPQAFQPKPLARTSNAKIPGEEYVGANGYIVKLSADGSKVLWGSYVGNNIECRDLAIDDEDNLYLTFGWLKDSAGELPRKLVRQCLLQAAPCRPHAARSRRGPWRDEGIQRREEGLLGDLHWRQRRQRPGGEPLRRARPLPDRLHRHLVQGHAHDSRRDEHQAQGLLVGQVLGRWIAADLRHIPGSGEDVGPQDTRRGPGFQGQHLRDLQRGRHLARDPRRLPAPVRRRQHGFRHRQALARRGNCWRPRTSAAAATRSTAPTPSP